MFIFHVSRCLNKFYFLLKEITTNLAENNLGSISLPITN